MVYYQEQSSGPSNRPKSLNIKIVTCLCLKSDIFFNFYNNVGDPIEITKDQCLHFQPDSPFLIWNDYKDTRVLELEVTNLFDYKITGIQGPIDTRLVEIPAFQIKFVRPILGGLDMIEINALKDGKLYTASYQGKPEAFQKHMDSFNKILSTIKI